MQQLINTSLSRLRAQRGQVMVLAAVGMIGICAMAGFAIDVGSWYRTHRAEQALADASALAAAADLPNSTSQATTDAQNYASKNGGSLSGTDISYSTTYTTNDTVTVQASTTAPSYFLKALGINSAAVKATATATAMPLSTAYGAGPFAIYYTQSELAGPGCPCYGVSTTLNYNKVGAGGFEIINIDGSSSGSGQTILANWITSGCSCSTATPVWLWGDPGAKFNSSEVNDALTSQMGKTLLFPVYDQNQANGSNMQYHIIAFVGFKVTGFKFNGSKDGTITGSFQKVTWRGSGGSSSPAAWSAITVQLTS
jgi:Flp pilus assembly protein TadG